MSYQIHVAAALAACALACSAAPAFADTTYDFTSVPQGTTVTPYTLQGATFDSPDGGAGAFTFGSNAGLYSQLGSSVLSSAGYPAALSISFATAQTGVSFDYAIGDEYDKNSSGVYSGNGSDTLTFTTNTGYSTTVNLAAPANNASGPAFTFPQGLFTLASAAGAFTSVTITAADSTGEESLAISTMASTPVPLPAAAWLLLSGIGGATVFARRRRVAG